MRISNKRDILRWFNDIRAGDGRRFLGRIQTVVTASGAPTYDPSAAPLDSQSEHLDPSTDIIFTGSGMFLLTSDKADPELFNSVIKRHGTLTVHPQYEEFFRQAYAVQIGGEHGEFEVITVATGAGKTDCEVKVQSRQ